MMIPNMGVIDSNVISLYLNDIDKQHFIMKQPSTQKIKEFSTMLISIVTVLISILQLLLSKSR
jgi:hypothetical protein